MDLIGWFTETAASIPLPLVWGLGALFSFLESGLGLGFFLPCETVVLILSATLSNVGSAVVMFALVAVFASAGDHVGYFIGHHLGSSLRETRLIKRLGQGNWDRAVAVLEKRGAWAVFLTRMVPVVRTLTPAAAGVAGVTYRSFLPASLAGAAMWSALYVGLGYLARSSLDAMQKYLGNVGWILAIVAVVVAALVVIVKVVRRRRTTSSADPASADPARAIGDGAQLALDIGEEGPGSRIPRERLALALLIARSVVVTAAAVAAGLGAYGATAILLLAFLATKPVQARLRPEQIGRRALLVEPVFDRVTVVAVWAGASASLGLTESLGILVALPEVLLLIGSLLAFRRLLELPITVAERARSVLELGGLTLLMSSFGLGPALSVPIAARGITIVALLAFLTGLIVAYVVAVQYSRAMFARWQIDQALGRRL